MTSLLLDADGSVGGQTDDSTIRIAHRIASVVVVVVSSR